MNDYARYAPGVCAALGVALQYLRSFGVPLWLATTLGGLAAAGTFLLVSPYAGDWRLYTLEGIVQTAGFGAAILGGLSATHIVATKAVEAGANPASPLVPVNPQE